MTGHVHTNAVGLHHGSLVVNVDDESGQQVALAMNQAEGIGVGAVGKADVQTHVECRLEARVPEGVVNLYVVERQHTHGDGALLVVAHGDEIALFCDHTHHITLFNTVVGMMDGA